MDTYPPYEDYRAFNRPKRRSTLTLLLLFVLGFGLGMFWTSRIQSTQRVDTAVKPVAEAHELSKTDLQNAMSYDRLVMDVAKKAMPAVVSIHTAVSFVYRYNDPFFNMFFGPQRDDIPAMGSGVIIGQDGIIITNNHVISIRNQIGRLDVILTDGRKFKAKVIRNFPEQDLAVLSIDGNNLPHLEIGSSGSLSTGQTVLAIGNPFGDSITGGLAGGEPTVTRGIISAMKRNLTIDTDSGIRYYRNMLQTDAAINEGNSGGALIDLNGNLIGVNTAIISKSGGSVGIGFAIPSDRVKLILDHYRKNDDIGKWDTGLKIQDITREMARSLKFKEEGGAVILDVKRNSPADKSGLKINDIITGVNGFTINDSEELVSMFRGSVPGETFTLIIVRGGKKMNKELKLGAQ
ncbi:MAG: trypsin-like peptidase domain-containing protein [Candidatus Latescibacter sp.]|nr:trypsin-like peptidase domain-containing protein [Candidatus Latescibacter sp.]